MATNTIASTPREAGIFQLQRYSHQRDRKLLELC